MLNVRRNRRNPSQVLTSVRSTVWRDSAPDDPVLEDRPPTADEFVDALAQGEIEVWFQPKVDLVSEQVVGVESLARWRHPTLGLLTPDRFLALLAPSGCYSQFTDEVLRQALTFAARTAAAGVPVDVAVNLDPQSFSDLALAERFGSMLRSARVQPSRVTLEITESEIIADLSRHMPVFHALLALGTRLSIDDFGVGYSSLSRLCKLPVSELKIDRSLVSAALVEPGALVVVQAVVDLSNSLGLCSVAEGLESRAAIDLLRDMGCTHGQGYVFARPMSGDEFFRRYATATA